MTVVEFLQSQYKFNKQLFPSDFQQAKEMEKEQKESFYKIGYLDGESKVRNFNENIYNETFKSE